MVTRMASPPSQSIGLTEEAERPRTPKSRRYQSYIALAFSLFGVAAWFMGLPALVCYLLWASGIAAWMYLKTV